MYPKKSLVSGILALTLLLAVICAPAFAAKFPEDREEFNGLAIDYTLTGVSIESGTDSGDFNWWKHLSGKVTGKTVTFSGTVHGYNSKYPSGEWASTTTVGVSITAGSQHAEQTIHSTDDPATEGKTWSKPFRVSVNVPDDAQTVTVSVGEAGSYGNGEDRGLGVDGTFTNPSYDPDAKPSASSGSGDELPLLPVAAGVVLLGGGALALKLIKGRPKPPAAPPLPHVPSKAEHHEKTWARREHIKNEMENDQALAKHYRQMGKAYGATGEKMETLVTAADFGVNVLEKATGPAGKVIKTGYTVIKDVTKNISSSYAKGESLWKGAARGTLEAGFDLGFDHLKKKLPSGPGNWEFKGSDTSVITGIADGLKSATQSQAVKTIVKDPIKDIMKKGSDSVLGSSIGTYK
jgi:hypothetical protein